MKFKHVLAKTAAIGCYLTIILIPVGIIIDLLSDILIELEKNNNKE